MVGIELWQRLYPKLADEEYLLEQLRQRKTREQMAKELGCSVKTVRKALAYHGLTRPYAHTNNPKILRLMGKN